MPKSITVEGISFAVGPEAVMDRPELARLIGCIAAEDAALDAALAEVFALLISAESSVTLSLYRDLRPKRKQTWKLLESIVLGGEGGEKAWQLIQRALVAQGHRDEIIHGTWAQSPHYPECLLLVDAKEVANWGVGLSVAVRDNNTPNVLARIAGPQGFKADVYAKEDLGKILAELSEVRGLLGRLKLAIMMLGTVQGGVSAFAQCYSLPKPEFASKLIGLKTQQRMESAR